MLNHFFNIIINLWLSDLYLGIQYLQRFFEGCHESITRESLRMVLPNLMPNEAITIPDSKTWEQIADNLVEERSGIETGQN